jgi:hypothetical protein
MVLAGFAGSVGVATAAPLRIRPLPFLARTAPGPSSTTPLYEATLANLSFDERATLASLEGLVNRKSAQLYLEAGGYDFWLAKLGRPIAHVQHAWDLIGQYRTAVRGMAVYDPAIPVTVDLATTEAGLQDLLVASPSVAATLQASFRFPIVVDLRGKFRDSLSAQTWAFVNLWPHTTHDMLVQIDPSNSVAMRDYAVASKAMVVYLHVDVPGEAALLAKMADQMPPDSPYLGWFSTTDGDASEVPSVRFLSAHGTYNVATSLFANMSALTKIAAPVATSQPSAKTPPLLNKVYLSFTISDGDNLSYLQQDRPAKWSDPARGTIPLNWTMNPLLATYAPLILSYYQHSATADDYLISGPSGPGYVYPSLMPAAAFAAYAQHMARTFQQAGIRVPFIQNNAPSVMLPAPLMATIESDVAPLGVEAFVRGQQTVYINGTTPVAAARLIHTVAEALSVVQQQVVAWNRRSPLFIQLYLNTWSLGPSDAVTIARTLGPTYQVVRGDQLMRLIRQAYGLPTR